MGWEHEIVKATQSVAKKQYNSQSRTAFYEGTVTAISPKLVVFIESLQIPVQEENLVLTSKVRGSLAEGDRVLLGGDQKFYIIDKL